MENLKVKVNNEVESKEVQELFFELGYDFYFGGKLYCNTHLDIVTANKDGLMANIELDGFEYKEITIQKLKDMVVLKRNDVGDATHINFRTNTPFLVQGSKEYFYLNNKWILSDSVNDLKPIEEKGMQEFLVKQGDKWTLRLLDSDTEENSYRVAVPSGATHYSEGKYSGKAVFFKVDGINQYEYCNDVWLSRRHPLNEMYFTTQLLWQRHTQPEELPFIDDEPKIETTTGYQLDAFGSNTYGLRSRYDGESDISYRQYLMNFIVGNRTESLNDQYAEIEQVRQETIKVTIDELKHRVYKKDVSHLDFIDVYRVLELFNVQSHAVGHAIKKLLCSGGRGAKDEAQDIQEAIDSLIRYREMKNEDE